MVEPHWQHIASQRIDSRGDAREAAEHRFLKLGAVDQLHGRRGGIIDGLLCECDELDSVKVESSSVMTVEKFVDTASIRFQLLPGTRWRCWPGRLCRPPEAIAKTGMTALSRVVISRRERTIALRPMGEGLMAHTLQEDRGLNSPKELFDGMAEIKTDPEMVQLATQLVQRQAGKYESADLELGSRLRALIDAKLKGEGIDSEADVPATTTSNVVDPMAALKKSLGQSPAEAQPKRKPAAQRAGKARDQAATRASRKRA